MSDSQNRIAEEKSAAHEVQVYLDTLLSAAREKQARPEVAAECVAGLQRRDRVARRRRQHERRRQWTWTVGSSLAVAALLLLVLPWRDKQIAASSQVASAVQAPVLASSLSLIQVGERVALAVAPQSIYSVVRADGQATLIQVEKGSVTARLYPDADRSYELVLQAKDLQVRATGTVFTVGVDDAGSAYSVVHEGSVKAARGNTPVELEAGQSFPKDAPTPPTLETAAASLAKHELTFHARLPTTPDAITVMDAGTAPSPTKPGAATAIELWRQARALRSTGQPTEAIAVLERLQKLGTSTWTPLAHLEIARVHDSDLSQPERALQQSRSFLERYPTHALAPEAREMACQELAQLGRSDPKLCH